MVIVALLKLHLTMYVFLWVFRAAYFLNSFFFNSYFLRLFGSVYVKPEPIILVTGYSLKLAHFVKRIYFYHV